ncbi:MAG: hypothetical protein A2381_00145 [Bdellovibrionales bacterium RIFOXYB1_FULL_37_110]|nr:MAG: hypothetical protein A2417_11200 [Bdellovibrionales bacterium RIFOXYC1_FULL_37_79]OFZ60807.1 MAG: hypothetical protein A2381_00145 [Bdellovibrionales bacterium RIFOXYB1_FULL_37_110]OFZ62337.1 MAG: hypothetical protein A2577_02810 [Bdellovibrionales bacterium RIFOXYD1_FULL_36_51]
MKSKLIKKLENEGKLKKQKVGFIQIENLLKEAIIDLSEAKKICLLSDRATYIMAYMAMLKAGRALLLTEGYVPDDGAQHKTVVEVTTQILGEEYHALTGQFERMRRKRNEMTYEISGLLSKTESEKALNDAMSLVKKILDEVKTRNPQIEFEFEFEEKKTN